MSAEFLLLTAFSYRATGGNPAAVVFTDLNKSEETLKDIAQNFNQPITAFVSDQALPSPGDRSSKPVAFSVCWYTASRLEAPLCGHGTLAAAKAVFERADVAPDTEIVEFHTRTRGVVTATKRPDGLIQIELPCAEIQEVSPEEFSRISKVINETSGRELKIEHIATGGKGFEQYVMIVLDETEDIKNLPINPNVLRQAGFVINVYTSASSNTEERFVSRMFSPGILPGDEDHVCGSAHCLMVPYWYKRLGIHATSQIKAKQVSARGGDLTISWDSERNRIRLAGEVVTLGKGELKLD